MTRAAEGGQPIPQGDGRMMFLGPVLPGRVAEQREAVVLASANALRAAEVTLAAGEEIAAILTMTVHVAAADGFTEHSEVADFASAFLRERLGERGIGSRCGVGAASLPGNAPVEIQLVCRLESDQQLKPYGTATCQPPSSTVKRAPRRFRSRSRIRSRGCSARTASRPALPSFSSATTPRPRSMSATRGAGPGKPAWRASNTRSRKAPRRPSSWR